MRSYAFNANLPNPIKLLNSCQTTASQTALLPSATQTCRGVLKKSLSPPLSPEKEVGKPRSAQFHHLRHKHEIDS